MVTPRAICIQALKKAGVIGVGETALPEDINDAFLDLQDMMAQWQVKRWLVYHLVDVVKTSTGAISYSIGPGADFDVSKRPDRIEAAFIRQTIAGAPNNVDYPLQIIQAREEYNLIAVKQLSSFSQYLWYDNSYPTGYVYPWPVLTYPGWDLHLSIKAIINNFSSLSQDIVLPPEYFAALKWNLAVKLCVSYKIPINQGLAVMAKDALNTIRNSNTQIPELNMPTEFTQQGIYNIYSDQIR